MEDRRVTIVTGSPYSRLLMPSEIEKERTLSRLVTDEAICNSLSGLDASAESASSVDRNAYE
jgi:hypothetical protein